ncbi:DgyrCDS9811 [Dimorphilus gyrociliatus]|uniref:DgyrCDS9811 n=1 Tax=Dimorphilus gyrociliatus TaxID=2664684 RepID=A0A7I8W0A3_9ANNE|nr:DgyrCDS9811 [Dimorphilus gyrociliatus]
MESKKQRDKSQRTNLIETPATKKSLFGAPVKIERDDSVKARINNSLCSHDTFMKTFETKSNNPHSLYGVNSQPSTPVTTATVKFPGRDSVKTYTSTPKHTKERKNKSMRHLALPTTNELVNNDEEKNKKVQEIIKEMTLVTPLSSIEPASKFAFPVKNSIQTKVQQNLPDQEKIQGHATNSNSTRSEQQKSHGNSNSLSDSSDNEDNDDKEECSKKSDINSNNLKENDDTRPPMKTNTSDESSSSSSSSSDSEASSSDDEKKIASPQADIDPMLNQPAPVAQDTWKIADFIGNIPNVSNSQESSTTNGKKKTDQSDNYPYGPVQPVRQAKKKAVYTSSGSDDSGDEDFEPAQSHSPGSKRQPNRKRKQPTNKKSPTKSKITKPFKPITVPSSDSDSSFEDISNGPNAQDEKSEETKLNIQPYYNSNSQKRKPMAVITPLNSTTPSNPNSITEMPTNNPNINAGVAPVGASQVHGRHSTVVSLSLELLRSVGVSIPRSNSTIPPTSSRERKRKKSPNETKDRGEKRIKKEPVEQSTSSSTHNPDYYLMQAAKECKREADNVVSFYLFLFFTDSLHHTLSFSHSLSFIFYNFSRFFSFEINQNFFKIYFVDKS